MSRRGTVEEKTAKSDPIYRNRLVNMLFNLILEFLWKKIGKIGPPSFLLYVICSIFFI